MKSFHQSQKLLLHTSYLVISWHVLRYNCWTVRTDAKVDNNPFQSISYFVLPRHLKRMKLPRRNYPSNDKLSEQTLL